MISADANNKARDQASRFSDPHSLARFSFSVSHGQANATSAGLFERTIREFSEWTPVSACSASVDDDSGYFFQAQDMAGIMLFVCLFQFFGVCLRGVELANDDHPLPQVLGAYVSAAYFVFAVGPEGPTVRACLLLSLPFVWCVRIGAFYRNDA